MNPRFLSLAIGALAAGTATAQWAQLTPATSPPARGSAVMAGDLIGNRLVLFGGVAGLTNYSDTWTYDGSTWTQQSPATSPPSRFASDMVFDSTRQVFVMYGGNATFTSPGTNQTWEYDGVTWAQRFPAQNPGNLGLHAMAFDSVRNVVVLYGGMPGGNPITDSNQTWEYDGVNWTQRFPANNPGRLEAHSMCFHAGVGQAILFGGVNANPNTPISLIDNDRTWGFDGTNWAELPVTGTRPPKRESSERSAAVSRLLCVPFAVGCEAEASETPSPPT